MISLSPLIVWAAVLVSGLGVFFLHSSLGAWSFLIFLPSLTIFQLFYTQKRVYTLPKSSLIQATLLLHGLAFVLPITTPMNGIRPIWDGFIQKLGLEPYLLAPADVGPGIASDFPFYSFIENIYSASPHSPLQEIGFKFAYLFSQNFDANRTLLVFQLFGIAIFVALIWSMFERMKVSGRTEKMMLIAWNPIGLLLISTQADLSMVAGLLLYWMITLQKDSTADIRGALAAVTTLTFWPTAIFNAKKENLDAKFIGIFVATFFVFALLFGGFWGMVSFFAENARFSDFWYQQSLSFSLIILISVQIVFVMVSAKLTTDLYLRLFLMMTLYFIIFTDHSGVAWISAMVALIVDEKVSNRDTALFSLVGLVPIFTRFLA